MRSFVVLAICCTLLTLSMQAAGFNIQVTTYSITSNAAQPEVSLAPFKRIGDGYYYVETGSSLNWYAAQLNCRRRGAQLASIESDEEMRALSDYLTSLGYNHWFWVSGSDLANKSQFTWLGTGQLMGYSKWLRGQPANSDNNQYCVHVAEHQGTYYMDFSVCSKALYSICEATNPEVVEVSVW